MHPKLKALENTRVYASKSFFCVFCGSDEAILKRHHVADELELYCQWCERFLNIHISLADIVRASRDDQAAIAVTSAVSLERLPRA